MNGTDERADGPCPGISSPALPHTSANSARGGALLMYEHDDAHHDDPLAVGKGIVWGVVMGSLMWIGIIGGVVYLMK